MAERFEIVEKALLAMLEDKKYATLRDILATMNPSDIAAVFQGLEEKQIPVMYRLLPKELAAETFVEMETEDQELNAFLFSLGCFGGEPITVITRRWGGCTVAIKDGRYNIDNQLAAAIALEQ